MIGSVSPRSARWVRRLARALLALFFRRVEVSGVEHLPADGGGLLIAWHPNGLIDPALLLATFPGHVVFGARHGLFAWPLLGSLLRACAVPIRRRQDLGTGDADAARRSNDASLAALGDAVTAGSWAVLFPEGDSHDEAHPLELRTGAARLLLDAAARSTAAPPRVVPVSLSYDRKRLFRSRALVVYHPPLELGEELGAASADEDARRAAVRALTDRFARALDAASLATEDWSEHYALDRLRRIFRAERAAHSGIDPGPSDLAERWRGLERVWTAYRALRDERRDEVTHLRARIEAYDREVRRLGLEEHELDRDPPAPHGRLLVVLALQRLVLDALLPPLLLVGLVANAPAVLLLEGVVRLAARRKKDQASIKLLVGALLFPAAWLAFALLAAWGGTAVARLFPKVPDLPWATGAAAFLLSAAGGVLLLVYGRLSRHWGRALLVRLRRRLNRARIERLLAERAAIRAEADRLAQGLLLPGHVAPGGRIHAYPAPGGDR